MITPINSPEHILHTLGSIEACRDFSGACHPDPAPCTKRTVQVTLGIARKLAYLADIADIVHLSDSYYANIKSGLTYGECRKVRDAIAGGA